MKTEVINGKYRKISLTALVTAVLAVTFCLLYFLLWVFFDGFLTSFINEYSFMPYIMFSYVLTGVSLTIVAVITAAIDLIKIKTGAHSIYGKRLDLTGIILSSILILFGFLLWFVDFFGFINIIT